nr:reverse transcriptase domain-containing protein [Tanacetum cinerariifolium]
MIQQVQNTCQFHGLPSDDANRHIDKFLEITQHMKQNGVSDDALRFSLFLYSLTHHVIAWYDRLPKNSIHSFDDMMKKFLSKYFPLSMVTKLRNEITKFEQKPHVSLFEAWERYKLSIDWFPNHNMILVTKIDTFYNGLTLSHRDTINAATGGTFMPKTPEECYELIENMTAHHNHWDTSAIRDETSRNISFTSTIECPEVVQLEMMNKNFSEIMRQFQMIKGVDTKCETCGGPPSFTECIAIGGYTQETAYATMCNYNSWGETRVPLRFGHSMHNIRKKNNDKSNDNEGYVEQSKVYDRSNGKGNDVQMKDKEKRVNEGFVGYLNDSVESGCLNAYVDQDVKCVDNNATSINDSVDTGMVNDSEECVKNNVSVDSSMMNNKENIVNTLKLDNKLLVIPTKVRENGSEVVIFDDELIELGNKVERKKILVLGKIAKIANRGLECERHNCFRKQPWRMRNEGVDKSRKTYKQTGNRRGRKNKENNVRENIKSQATSRFEYRRRMDEWKSDKNVGGKGIEKDVNKGKT